MGGGEVIAKCKLSGKARFFCFLGRECLENCDYPSALVFLLEAEQVNFYGCCHPCLSWSESTLDFKLHFFPFVLLVGSKTLGIFIEF